MQRRIEGLQEENIKLREELENCEGEISGLGSLQSRLLGIYILSKQKHLTKREML